MDYTDNEVEILEVCRKNGVLGSFTKVFKAISLSVPRNVERCFIGFLRRIEVAEITPEVQQALDAHLTGELKLFRSKGIGMLYRNGKFFCFIPLIPPVQAECPINESRSKPFKQRKPVGTHRFSGAGYVPAECPIFREALLHAWGDQGRDMRAIRLRP